ncbi:uncharacterized protein LOC128677214 [Plodia interpunctella]|uniref:uncharacterized protein LOC128677214 n=1 Tax=Plodia interpunctella TaxID=58824 RepID=UPI002368AE0E|nr:uncharacterized protein LOC128677214 [Plodia interpunctella]
MNNCYTMYWILLELTIIFYFVTMNHFIMTEVDESPREIQSYEYGAHVLGEKKSFWHVGTIPKLTSLLTLNITPTAEGLENRFTYMRVEYVNAVSNVIVMYDPHTNMLSITVVFPFLETPFGVVGYSMPAQEKNQPNATK